MAQFDVYRNANAATQDGFPYLLDVQAELLDSLATRVVVPLARATEAPRPAKILNPKFRIRGTEVVMLTQELAGIPARALGEQVASLASKRAEIVGALDLLITGF